MFPPELVRYFIQKYTRPGDVVADLWAGVGTVPLEACMMGRYGIGNDVSPEAYTVMRAKLDPPRQEEFMKYLGELRSRIGRYRSSIDKLGNELGVAKYYHPDTLREILAIRRVLKVDQEHGRLRRNAIFTSALMLGMLHGSRAESLSLPLDSAKATSVRHIITMQKSYPGQYSARYKNTIDALFLKAAKVFSDYIPEYRGQALNLDASSVNLNKIQKRVKLFLTSPPYLDVHTYAYDNRIRLWFLGVDYKKLKEKLFCTQSLNVYFSGILGTLKSMEGMLDHNGACVVVVGDVRVEKNQTIELGEALAERWLGESSKMRLERVIVDPIKPFRKRYFNLQNGGVRMERILEFRIGRASTREPCIDWSYREYPRRTHDSRRPAVSEEVLTPIPTPC